MLYVDDLSFTTVDVDLISSHGCEEMRIESAYNHVDAPGVSTRTVVHCSPGHHRCDERKPLPAFADSSIYRRHSQVTDISGSGKAPGLTMRKSIETPCCEHNTTIRYGQYCLCKTYGSNVAYGAELFAFLLDINTDFGAE